MSALYREQVDAHRDLVEHVRGSQEYGTCPNSRCDASLRWHRRNGYDVVDGDVVVRPRTCPDWATVVPRPVEVLDVVPAPRSGVPARDAVSAA